MTAAAGLWYNGVGAVLPRRTVSTAEPRCRIELFKCQFLHGPLQERDKRPVKRTLLFFDCVGIDSFLRYLPVSMNDCWPDWLKRRSSQTYGPDFTPYEAYPIYQVQPPIISSENSNTQRAGQENAFYQYAAGVIATANTPLRIVHIQPNSVFDCVSILAFDDHVPSSDATNIPVPIFFSWDKPSRIQTEVQIAGSRDAFMATALAFASANVSDIPTAVYLASPFSNINNAVYYNSVTVEAPRTNRPFYVWFNDGIVQKPTGNAVFKIQWFTRGR